MKNSDERLAQSNQVTIVGLLIDVVLFIFKIWSGIVGKSGALIADAIHTLSDFLTDFIVLWGVAFGNKPVDKSHDYGHGKIETLASTLIGIALLIVSWEIAVHGVLNIIHLWKGEKLPSPGWIAFIAAVVSTVVKEWLYHYTAKVGRDFNSHVVTANASHHRSDVYSSIAVMIGVGGAILLGDKWQILDPFAAVVLSFFIARPAILICARSINELLEASLSDEEEAKILQAITTIPGVKNPHDLRTRRIGNNVAIDIHIEVDKSLNIVAAHDISSRVEDKIRKIFGNQTFISVHVEPA